MKAKIYQPAKSATQSAKSDFWLLEFSSQDQPIIDDKMLWTSSSNTQDKVKIRLSIIVGLKLELIDCAHLIVPDLAFIEKNSFLLFER